MQRRKRHQITGTSQTRSKNRDAVERSEPEKFVASPLNQSQALDYFFKIGVDITPYEKNLLKFCKSNLHLCQTHSQIVRLPVWALHVRNSTRNSLLPVTELYPTNDMHGSPSASVDHHLCRGWHDSYAWCFNPS